MLYITKLARLAAFRSIGKSVSSSCPQRDLSQTQFSGVKDMLNQVNYQAIALKYRIEVSSIMSYKADRSSYSYVTCVHSLVSSSDHHVSWSVVTKQPFLTLSGWYAGLDTCSYCFILILFCVCRPSDFAFLDCCRFIMLLNNCYPG